MAKYKDIFGNMRECDDKTITISLERYNSLIIKEAIADCLVEAKKKEKELKWDVSMTESEAIEKLKNMRLFMQITDKNSDCKFTEDDYKANDMAIQALEKQISEKPVNYYKHHYKCPCCNEDLEIDYDMLFVYDEEPPKFCIKCGQKLDWSD